MENDIFKECRYNRRVFLKKHLENRELTVNEVDTLNNLLETCKEFKLYPISNIADSNNKLCLFKIMDNVWVVWETDEKKGFYNPKIFDNVYDACIEIIDRNFIPTIKKQQYVNNKNNLILLWTAVITHFNILYEKELSNDEKKIQKFNK